MELRQLEYLVAVAEEASFTRAAERVHISQSGVSAQIRALERELGARLVDRSTRTATMTAAGTAALEGARATLAAAAGLRRAVDDVTGVVRGSLTVGMVVGCTLTPLFEALAGFHSAHPGVALRLVEGDSARLVGDVRAGRVDVALVGVLSLPEGLAATTVVSEPLVAAVPTGHPLAGRGRVTLADLATTPLVCLPVGTGVRAVFDEACATAGVRVDVVLEASSPEAVADLAARGLGAAVLSASMPAGDARLDVLALADATAPALLAFVWRPTPDRPRSALLDRVHAAFGVRTAVA
ncbi:LysR family transcriptional regulator [Geodermatophilus sp. SYSU D01105]